MQPFWLQGFAFPVFDFLFDFSLPCKADSDSASQRVSEMSGAGDVDQTSESAPAVGDDFMKNMDSIKLRYPGLEGLLLYKKVVEHWHNPSVRRLAFFDSRGKKLLHRHPLNKFRGQPSIVDNYKDGILRFGLQPHCRGNSIAIPRT
eukprot:987767-Pyramimonas_sp.AAC.1